MTKNRARKRAARERAQVTGESYVVARRNIVTDVPTPLRRAKPAGHGRTHPVRRKRILVGWQTRIERLVTGNHEPR